jgi:bacteriocin-like protein
MKQDLLKGLTEEQIAKVKECKNQEELLKLAKAEGIELNDEQLAAISGGACSGEDKDDKKDKGPTNNPF